MNLQKTGIGSNYSSIVEYLVGICNVYEMTAILCIRAHGVNGEGEFARGTPSRYNKVQVEG